MNSSDLRPHPAFEFPTASFGALQAFIVAVGGGLLYLSFFNRKRFAAVADAIVKEEKPQVCRCVVATRALV